MTENPDTYNMNRSKDGNCQDHRTPSYATCVGPANIGKLYPVDGVHDECDGSTSE